MRLIKEYSRFAFNFVCGMIVFMSLTPFNVFSATHRYAENLIFVTDTINIDEPIALPDHEVKNQFLIESDADSILAISLDTLSIENHNESVALFDEGVVIDSLQTSNKKVFIPDPTRAVWLSALCPGLGQVYNRRYWKLPIVIGGFMGLGYGASWNNSMLTDYTRAYYDLMDNDPSTKSYMDFFPPTTKEESLNHTWLERTLKSRKDYFRRNRDLCIIGMIGVYLIAVVDAYVDASLTNFDINPDLSMQVVPSLLYDNNSPYPAVGVMMAINF